VTGKDAGSVGKAQEQAMPNASYYEVCAGHIAGLQLPYATWDVLMREGITTLDQFRAAAGQIEQFAGIGRKSAQIIREELARVAPPDQDQ
jgi:hypothetical protein